MVLNDVIGSNVAGRDINQTIHGVSPVKHAEALARIEILREKLGIENPIVMGLEEETAKSLEKDIEGLQYKISIGHNVGKEEYWSSLDIKQNVSHYLGEIGVDDFTITLSEGSWKGDPEKSTVITIIRKIDEVDIYGSLVKVVTRLKEELQQENILLTRSEILNFDSI